MTPEPQIDIVTVAIVIAAAVFGREVAEIIGPYSVIFLSALGCGAWSASRLPPSSRLNTLGYLVLVVLLAMMITVPAADALARYTGVQAQVLFAPVAGLITAVGPDWPGVLRWATGLFRSAVERWARARDDSPPEGR